MNNIFAPLDPTQSPRAAVEAALAKLPPQRCTTHPDEVLELDRKSIFRDFACENRLTFRADYDVCPSCPYVTDDSSTFLRWRRSSSGEFSNCASKSPYWHHDPEFNHGLNDANRPGETHQTSLQLDTPLQQLLDEWLAQLPPKSCDFHAHVAGAQAGPLTRFSASVRITLRDRSAEAASAAEFHYYSRQSERKVPAQHYVVTPRWHPCPACELAKIDVPPIHLRSAFDRFVIRDPVLAGHLAKCQEFAADPRGFLLLHGSVGGGKTFLAVAIARALLRRLKTLFISHSELLRRHRLTYLRPAQGEDRPKDIIAACQSAGLLIFDDLGRRREGRDEDAVLHEVLSYRYEHLRPTILTGNLDKPALHELLGDALYDRIQEACFARIEFGLPSYRADLNAPYLAAAKSRQERP